MIGWITGLTVKAGLRNVPPILWKVAGALIGAALLWIGWSLFDRANDRAAIARDRAASALETAERQAGADRAAGAARDTRDAAADQHQRALEEKGDAALRDGRSPWDAVANEL